MTDYREDIRAAVAALRKGGIILYPTDTVWGIGCDATNPDAVRRVFEIKRRADAKALITLVGSLAQLERTVSGIPEVAYQLIRVSAPRGPIGVRVTAEDFSRSLCLAFGKPLVSTSANISGAPTAATFAEISPEILDAADYVCTSRRNDTTPAKPSTVMRLSEDGAFKVIRP